jgi:hypothetical protein
LHREAFDVPRSVDVDTIEPHPGISADMATVSPVIAASIGHCPVVPLAASPLRGSTAHSSKARGVRRIFIAASIERSKILFAFAVRLCFSGD